jgi:hypothetical protein
MRRYGLFEGKVVGAELVELVAMRPIADMLCSF